MRYSAFFDLIAEVYSIYLQKFKGEEESISDAYQDTLAENAKDLIFGTPLKLCSFDTFNCNSAKRDAIIRACSETDNVFLIRTVLTKLDSIIQTDKLVHDYDFNGLSTENEAKVFTSLNRNYDQTKIYILPKLPSVETINYRPDTKGETIELRSKPADAYTDSLNSTLRHIQCICIDEKLAPYKLKNIIIKPKEKIDNDSFVIALSPICNHKRDDLFKFTYSPDPEAEEYDKKYLSDPLFFTDVKIKMTDEINSRCEDIIKKACSRDADMIVFPEMFGTEELCGTDENAFNPVYHGLSDLYPDNMPCVIAAPTRWKNNANVLNLFSQMGEKMGEQYKQYPFRLHGPKGDYLEKLSNPPKEITIVHINGIGSFAFPVCIDLLHEDYISLLISTLKVNWVICPSFSPGTRDFEEKISICSGLGARCIWLNSCSAIEYLPEPPDYIGLVASPIISSDSHISRIRMGCNRECRNECVFLISVPLNSAGRTLHEDSLPTIEHL